MNLAHGVKLLLLKHEDEFIEVDFGNVLRVGGGQESARHLRMDEGRIGMEQRNDGILVLERHGAPLRGEPHQAFEPVDERRRVAVVGFAPFERTRNGSKRDHEQHGARGTYQSDRKSARGARRAHGATGLLSDGFVGSVGRSAGVVVGMAFPISS